MAMTVKIKIKLILAHRNYPVAADNRLYFLTGHFQRALKCSLI